PDVQFFGILEIVVAHGDSERQGARNITPHLSGVATETTVRQHLFPAAAGAVPARLRRATPPKATDRASLVHGAGQRTGTGRARLLAPLQDHAGLEKRGSPGDRWGHCLALPARQAGYSSVLYLVS